MQQHIAVPPALVQTTYNFQTSAIRQQWQHRNIASPGSICEISFRMVNLRAAFQNGEVTDPQVIREAALDIDSDLETWRAGVPLNWRYATIDATEAPVGTCFDGKRHVYPSLWIAEVWNSWRTLRILVNQIIVQNELRSSVPGNAQKSIALSIIHQFSTELCISTTSFMDTPRRSLSSAQTPVHNSTFFIGFLSLIPPLHIVSLEELNARSVRSFAVEQLRRIDASMGIRQAGLLAETVSKSLGESPRDFVSVPSHLMI
jgi:hypothetical protein